MTGGGTKLMETRLFFAGLCLVLTSGVLQAEPWQLARQSDGITVHLRPVPPSALKEFRGTMRMKTTVTALVALMIDTGSYTSWMHNCIEARLTSEQDWKHRTTYIVNSAPWPVKNRDLVVTSQLSQDPVSRTVTIRLLSTPMALGPHADRVRVARFSGSWTFRPAGEGIVDVTYRVFADPGGSLPTGLANAVVVDVPYNTLRQMARKVSEERYQLARPPGLLP